MKKSPENPHKKIKAHSRKKWEILKEKLPKEQVQRIEKSNQEHEERVARRFKNKFSLPFRLDPKKIEIAPQIFQGRETPFSQETVNKILEEGYDPSYEPIVVFREEQFQGQDTSKGKFIVISGHSRLHAVLNLLKMPSIKLLL